MGKKCYPMSPTKPGHIYFRTCGAKKKYPTREEAERGNKDKVYRCPFCGEFHRTSEKRRGA